MGQTTLISISHLCTCKFSWQNLAQPLRWQNLAASAHFEVLITTFVIGADTVSVTRSTFFYGIHTHTYTHTHIHTRVHTHTKTNSQGENNISFTDAAGNKKSEMWEKGGEEMPYRLTSQENKSIYDFRKKSDFFWPSRGKNLSELLGFNAFTVGNVALSELLTGVVAERLSQRCPCCHVAKGQHFVFLFFCKVSFPKSSVQLYYGLSVDS